MKRLIYIDTNIYLRFFDSNQADYKTLLKTIPDLKPNIFITKQIQFEIERRKADVFKLSFETYLKQAKLFNSVTLPEHLDNIRNSEIKEWNHERGQVIKSLEKSNKKLNEIFRNKLALISKSEDEVSKTLSSLYSKAKEYSNEELKKAQLRKERGNPPGKQNDPLGDQINWEQLLNAISEIDELYIITNDSDLLLGIDNESFLNPVLYQELLIRNGDLKINCFHSLSNALKSLKHAFSSKQINIPSDLILEKINHKEEKDFREKTTTLNLKGYDMRAEMIQGSHYLYKHGMIGKEEFTKRLKELEFTPLEITSFIEGRI